MNHASTPHQDDAAADVPTVRVTVPVRQDVLETFQRLAKAGGMSTGRAMGEWLADTSAAVLYMAEKMEQARSAPRLVAREIHSYALGLADETGELLRKVREQSQPARPAAGGPRLRGAPLADGPAAASPPPSPRPVIRGGKSPKATTKARGKKV